MPRTARSKARLLPALNPTLLSLNVEILKWYAAPLPGQIPTRKGDLVDYLLAQLLDPEALSSLIGALSAEQRGVIAEVVHALDGIYSEEVIRAKYPAAPLPLVKDGYYGLYGYWGNNNKPLAQPFDLFFYHDSALETTYIPGDL